jgi:transcriptional regulator with XRE-family HTH domain
MKRINKDDKLLTFGERLAWLRVSKKHTQIEMGKRVGLTPRQISLYETNSINASQTTLCSIANAYNVSLDWLLLGKEVFVDLPFKNEVLLKRFLVIQDLHYHIVEFVIQFLDMVVDSYRIGVLRGTRDSQNWNQPASTIIKDMNRLSSIEEK